MSDTLTLKTGEIIQKGDRIHLRSRSYIFVEKDETSECVDMGDTGNFTFIGNVKDGILVCNSEIGGTIFVYTGPDRVMPSGLHMRKPEITLPKAKAIRGVKRKKKTIVEMAPTVIGSKKKEEPPKKRRGRPPKTEGESNRKTVSTKKRGRGRSKKGTK